MLRFFLLFIFCCSVGFPYDFALRGDLLYFTPGFEETYYVIKGTERDSLGQVAPSGKRRNNLMDYSLGFRLEGVSAFSDCDYDFRIRWTHLLACRKQTVFSQGPALWPVEDLPEDTFVDEPFAGFAFSRLSIMHQRLEFLFDEKVWQPDWGCLFLRQGLGWHYIRYHEAIEYKQKGGAHERLQFHGHTKGFGPQLGAILLVEPSRFFACMPDNLALKVTTEACLIVANSKAKAAKTADGKRQSRWITQSSFWKLVPEWMIGAGLKYTTRCICPIAVEAGYELSTYFRGTSKLIFTNPAQSSYSFNQYCDFYVHGFYASLSCYF